MTLNEMRRLRIEMGLSYKEMAEKSGIPLGTLQKVFGGITLNPRRETLRKVEDALLKERRISPAGTMMISEPPAPYYAGQGAEIPEVQGDSAHYYPRQGQYTVKDYLSLPDDQRVELIDGVFYDMASPTSMHQMIVTSLSRQIGNYIEKNKGKCVTFVSPMDVQLDRDLKTMLEPDLFVVCDRNKITEHYIFGAPDLIIEVVSPSSRLNDYVLKLWKYANSGVREYWIIDYKKDLVRTFFFDDDDMDPVDYTLKDDIPVRIYDGKLTINLQGTVIK